MKKGLKLFACGFVAMTAMANYVSAEEVKTEAELNTCVAKESVTCTLKNDVEVSSVVEIGNKTVLDLNGYTLSANQETFADDSMLVVLRNGALTVQDSSTTKKGKLDGENDNLATTIKLTKKGENDATNAATLIVDSGTVVGKSLAISGNGLRHNTVVKINGGEISSTEGTAIYHPQSGTLDVTGGTIIGKTGIEMRSGSLNVTGGTIRGTYKPVDVKPNGSGTTTSGAGIAIAQHTTEQEINVKISNGTIEGHTALYESNPEENAEAAIEKISLEITGGTFNAINDGTNAVYSENLTGFITGGEFNTSVDSTYLVASTEESDAKADVYEVVTPEGETKYVVADENEVVETPFEAETTTGEDMEKEIAEMEKMLSEVNKDELTEEELEEFEEIESFLEQIKEALDGKNIASAHDIYYGSFIGENYVENSNKTKLDKAVEVTLEVPETLEKVKEGYTRKYSVIRLHWDEDAEEYEVKTLPATEKDGKVTFETDKFSTYVLAYEDVKKTTNPDTGDSMLTYFVASIISVVGLMLTTLKITKKSK